MKNETEKHYYVKFFIAQRLKQYHFNVEIEPYFSKIMQYPDILVDAKVAIEVQFSRISIKRLNLDQEDLNKLELQLFGLSNNYNIVRVIYT